MLENASETVHSGAYACDALRPLLRHVFSMSHSFPHSLQAPAVAMYLVVDGIVGPDVCESIGGA